MQESFDNGHFEWKLFACDSPEERHTTVNSISKWEKFNFSFVKHQKYHFSRHNFDFTFGRNNFHVRIRQRASHINAWEKHVVFAGISADNLHFLFVIVAWIDWRDQTRVQHSCDSWNVFNVLMDERFEFWRLVVVQVSLKDSEFFLFSYFSFFRNFDLPSNNEKFFKFYCGYAFGFTLWLTFIFTLSVEKESVLENALAILFFLGLSLLVVVVADVVFIVMTFMKIKEMSKVASLESNFRFQEEKERFEINSVCH